ncbi:MAG: hypothetical protein Ta2A_01050 [Treponemataceae bacterium]|nr:MAG: hypothetical protein Ta2A_01050 [Treponemataceae bacterium]
MRRWLVLAAGECPSRKPNAVLQAGLNKWHGLTTITKNSCLIQCLPRRWLLVEYALALQALPALGENLHQKDIDSQFDDNLGTGTDLYLFAKGLKVKFITNMEGLPVFETNSDDPISEATDSLSEN